jgi:hypothetical protein
MKGCQETPNLVKIGHEIAGTLPEELSKLKEGQYESNGSYLFPWKLQ